MPKLRARRVRCGDRSPEGLRRRHEDETLAWAGFRAVAIVLLNDQAGAERVGELLVEVVTGRRPLNGVETREAFLRGVGVGWPDFVCELPAQFVRIPDCRLFSQPRVTFWRARECHVRSMS